MKPKIKTMPCSLQGGGPSFWFKLFLLQRTVNRSQGVCAPSPGYRRSRRRRRSLGFPARQVSVHRNRYFHFSFLFPHFSFLDFRCADRTRTFLLNFIRRQTGSIRIELHSNICFRSKNIFRHFYWLLVAFLSYTFRFFFFIWYFTVSHLSFGFGIDAEQMRARHKRIRTCLIKILNWQKYVNCLLSVPVWKPLQFTLPGF